MGNPIFNLLNQGPPQTQNNPFGNMTNMMERFNQFKNTVKGDPRQQVQSLLNSGQMSQDQFNYLSNLAKQFQRMFGGSR